MIPEFKKQPARQEPAGARRAVVETASRLGETPDQLIPILQEVQKRFNYLPPSAIEEAAAKLELPLIQVYQAATFFSAFSLEPRGEKIISVCMGTACHVREGPLILEALERRLAISAGETTGDGRYTLLSVGCLGACALGPVIDVNGRTHGHMNVQKAEKLVEQMDKEARLGKA